MNVFNHVNLGNPNATIGSFQRDSNTFSQNSELGIINSTAYGGADPQRNFQFALKFKF